MHAAVRRYRVRDIDALVSKIEDEFADRVKEIDGFVGYYVIDGDDGTAASVTVGETAQAVAESTRLAGDWVRESASELVEGSPEVTVGKVRVRAERDELARPAATGRAPAAARGRSRSRAAPPPARATLRSCAC